MKRRFLVLLVFLAGLAGSLGAQSMFLVSGNGQMVNAPSTKPTSLFVVQVNDAQGKPLSGVNITWAITSGMGSIPHPTFVTDSSGQATCDFTSGTLQADSYAETTVTATSKYGSVNFTVITVAFLLSNGFQAIPPGVNLEQPGPGATITAQPGSTIPHAVQVKVTAGTGSESNHPIANVGLYLVDAITLMPTAAAHCSAPGGVVYTDATGVATCDLVVTGSAGRTYSLRANVGQYNNTVSFTLQVNPGPTCSYSISPTSSPMNAAGGNGTVKVTASSGCSWAANSNVDWISITSGASGTGNGTVSYSVGADSGDARSGTMTVAGQTFTVNQGSGSNPGTLTITTPANLPAGTVSQFYSTTLAASGGIAPYTWSITQGALPAGLTLNPSTGAISGAPTAAGPGSFTATVQDSAGTTVSLVFSVTISTTSSTFQITNKSFPNGVVGTAYNQVLASSGGHVTPFAPSPVFQVSGSLPDGLKLVRNNSDLSYAISGTPTTAGVSNFTLTATDALGASTAASFTITITGPTVQETMTATPGSLSFTVQLGATTAPSPQTLSITGSSGVLAYTSVATSDANWLALQNPSGNTRGQIIVSVNNYSNLPAGNYTGTVTISSQASNSPVAVPVMLTVVAAPALTVSPAQINLTQGQSTGANIATQKIQVSAGDGSGQAQDASAVNFTAVATTNKGGGWLTVSQASGTTPATLTASIDSGGLAVGTYSGKITISPTAGAVQLVTVTLNVINPQMLSATPAPVAFTYVQGASTPAAQTVTVSANTAPALNLTAAVATSDKGSWLSVNPNSGATPLGLSISVNPAGLAPNTYTGTITVTASDDSVAPLPIPVTLTVTPAGPTISSVVNAASFAPGPIAPGELVTIFGAGLGPDQALGADTSSGSISRTVGGTQVFFDDNAAPIIYTSATQVSVIVPYELASSSSTKLTVWYQGTASAVDNLRVIEAVPGIFMLNSSGRGAIVNQDLTVNSASNGAPVGSIVSIFATGQGNLPPAIDGAISTAASAQPPPLPVTVSIGGLPATVKYAGAAPDEPAGIMQVNAIIPAGVAAGTSVPIVVTVGTAPSQAGVTIAIHP